jgi:hypothetical protein
MRLVIVPSPATHTVVSLAFSPSPPARRFLDRSGSAGLGASLGADADADVDADVDGDREGSTATGATRIENVTRSQYATLPLSLFTLGRDPKVRAGLYMSVGKQRSDGQLE